MSAADHVAHEDQQGRHSNAEADLVNRLNVKRQRAVHRCCPEHLRGTDLTTIYHVSADGTRLQQHGTYQPAPSPDSVLTSFAQLVAVKLQASRAFVSLFDNETQYVLAEATPATPLGPARRNEASRGLWIGNVNHPKSWGLCERVLCVKQTNEDAYQRPQVLVINDLPHLKEQIDAPMLLADMPHMQSYIGVSILTSRGLPIGTLGLLNEHEHAPLSVENHTVLEDLSATITAYLQTLRIKEDRRRGDRMVRGLASFLGGSRHLSLHQDESHDSPGESSHTPRENARSRSQSKIRSANSQSQSAEVANATKFGTNVLETLMEMHATSQDATVEKKAAQAKSPSQMDSDIKSLQESVLPEDSRLMFARAANVIRQTSELDGVVFFNASVASGDPSGRDTAPSRQIRSSHQPFSAIGTKSSLSHTSSVSDSSGEESPDGSSSRSRKIPALCQILGFSSGEGPSSVGGNTASAAYHSLSERDLKMLLKMYPSGKVLNFSANGLAHDSTEESSTAGGPSDTAEGEVSDQQPPPRKSKRSTALKVLKFLSAVAPGAHSICFLPLWDYERRRWFAGGLFWTTKSDRILTASLDLTYLKAFGNSMMTELARLQQIALRKSQSTFVASISHELRSPLHGILGGAEFLRDAPLDSFGLSMLHSIETCGRTLLDTLDHVLDHAKLNEFSKSPESSIKVKGATVQSGSRRRRGNRPSNPAADLFSVVNLATVTEEVVEAVFAGKSYRVFRGTPDIDQDYFGQSITPMSPDIQTYGSPSTRLPSDQESINREPVAIILDISEEADRAVNLAVGGWRRIVMNLVGNSLKYTPSGFVKISLRARTDSTSQMSDIVLTVADSGIGMTPEFLQERVFQPFQQEDSLSSGTGLGLSIVRHIVQTMQGRIHLQSTLGKGTTLTVNLSVRNVHSPTEPVASLNNATFIGQARTRLRGRIVRLSRISGLPSQFSQMFATSLFTTLRVWLEIEDGDEMIDASRQADVVICTEPDFSYLRRIRAERGDGQKAPVTIFLTTDALEASVLRNDARVLSKESVVEIMTQPCGPYKLAKILDHCLDRHASSAENMPTMASAQPQSSKVSVSEPTQHQTTSSQAILPESYPAVLANQASNVSQSPPGIPIRPKLSHASSDSVGSNIKVLIVDDNQINRRLLVAFMRRSKYSYLEASNGLEAVQHYEATATDIHVVLMDISMPVMDGMTATSRIRAFEAKNGLSRTPVIALTGLASASARLEAVKSGVDEYITKPVDFPKLHKTLQRILEGMENTNKPGEAQEFSKTELDA